VKSTWVTVTNAYIFFGDSLSRWDAQP